MAVLNPRISSAIEFSALAAAASMLLALNCAFSAEAASLAGNTSRGVVRARRSSNSITIPSGNLKSSITVNTLTSQSAASKDCLICSAKRRASKSGTLYICTVIPAKAFKSPICLGRLGATSASSSNLVRRSSSNVCESSRILSSDFLPGKYPVASPAPPATKVTNSTTAVIGLSQKSASSSESRNNNSRNATDATSTVPKSAQKLWV